MEEEEQDNNFINAFFHAPPSLISLANFSPSIRTSSCRRLSSQFSEPTRPINSDRRLSWVSLEGRLIGAEEASSAKAIKGNLGLDEVIAWDLFSPIHRVLIVAIIAVATNDLKKSRQISSLKRSVDLRVRFD
ncbi:inactive rhomboid protein [Thalictrum thalictroides]|uniref:Inactive rhomboid protein n=1 Tax=Thalictrum thalictroides TaxID=46969 RepID=A0A7J6WPA2_THATH|nr:inactive rhomboid protein [Thalictrum thalictroides]